MPGALRHGGLEGVAMPDPVLVAIAAALAGKAAGSAAAGTASALRSLVELVRSRFAGRPDAEQALEEAQREPEKSGSIERLGAVLERAVGEDPLFGEQLLALWGRAGAELRADSGGVLNQVSGAVGGHVAQARDVTGGISFGSSDAR